VWLARAATASGSNKRATRSPSVSIFVAHGALSLVAALVRSTRTHTQGFRPKYSRALLQCLSPMRPHGVVRASVSASRHEVLCLQAHAVVARDDSVSALSLAGECPETEVMDASSPRRGVAGHRSAVASHASTTVAPAQEAPEESSERRRGPPRTPMECPFPASPSQSP
jgi:hypothetical protein